FPRLITPPPPSPTIFPYTTLFRSTLPQIENAKRTVEDLIGKTVRGIWQKEIRVPIEKLKELGFSYISNIERASMFFPLKRLKTRSEEHTSELQSRENLVCRLLLER